jgi:hypothetical protein
MQTIRPIMSMPLPGQPLGLAPTGAAAASPFDQLFQSALRHLDAMALEAKAPKTVATEPGGAKQVRAQAALSAAARIGDRVLGAFNEIKDMRI